MLIGIDASRANRKFKSGTEWYSYHLIRELAKIDSKNQYILYSDRPLVGGLADLCAKSPHHNFRGRILNWPLGYFWTQARLSYEMLVRRPDVLFVPAHVLPLIHPKKSVVTIHDIGFSRQAELYGQDKIGPASGKLAGFIKFLAGLFTLGKFKPTVLDYHDWAVKFALKRARAVIAVSQFTKLEIMKIYQAPPEKIKVVYNGFNGKLYRPIADQEKINQVLEKYGIKRPYIFYVGRLEKKKNTARLAEAFAIMRQNQPRLKHKLVLIGSAGLGYDEIKYVIEEFNLNDEVIMPGWVPEADLPFIYNGAELFVFPSLYEGFGIPLLEAMSSGIPVAAANAAAIPEVARDAAALFNPLDKDDMAQKMAKLLLDRQAAQELIKRGRLRAKEFSWKKCAQETLAVLENL